MSFADSNNDPARLEQIRYSLEKLQEGTGVGTLDVARQTADFGVASYFPSHEPWLVPEPVTLEPSESYSRADLDEYAEIMAEISREASAEPKTVLGAPYRSTVHQMDATPHDDPERWALTWRAYLRKIRETGRAKGPRIPPCGLRPGDRRIGRVGRGRLRIDVPPEPRGPGGLLARGGGGVDWHTSRSGSSTIRTAVLPLVPRRRAQHLLQRDRPPCRRRPRRPARADLRLPGHRARASLTRSPSCATRSRGSPARLPASAWARAIASSSTCRWCRRRWSRCSPARASAPSIRWSSAASPPTSSRFGSMTPAEGHRLRVLRHRGQRVVEYKPLLDGAIELAQHKPTTA